MTRLPDDEELTDATIIPMHHPSDGEDQHLMITTDRYCPEQTDQAKPSTCVWQETTRLNLRIYNQVLHVAQCVLCGSVMWWNEGD